MKETAWIGFHSRVGTVAAGANEQLTTIRLGWLRRIVFEAILRRLIGLVEDARRQLPITFHFQVGRIRGRLIVDEF